MALRNYAAAESNPYRARVQSPLEVEPPPQAETAEDQADVITAEQIRAGRALLDWTRQELAVVSKVGEATIARIETGTIDPKASSLSAIETALSSVGVEIIPAIDGKGEGVRWAAPRSQRKEIPRPDVPKKKKAKEAQS